jgi:hypothetical protein
MRQHQNRLSPEGQWQISDQNNPFVLYVPNLGLLRALARTGRSTKTTSPSAEEEQSNNT